MVWTFIKHNRLGIGVAALILGALFYAFRPQPLDVDVAVVDRGAMDIRITDDGVTRVRDIYRVSAPVTGRITRIEIDAGDTVVAGQTEIVRIRPRPPGLLDARTRTERENALASAISAQSLANADRQRAQASLTLAQKTLARAEDLSKQGFATKARLDEARTGVNERLAEVSMANAAFARSASEVARAQAALQQDENNETIEPVIVTAPTSGRVLQVLRESEAIVMEGTPLVEIGNPKKIEIVADLLSRDAVRVNAGNKVRISRWGGDPIDGTVRLVEPFGFLKVSALGIEEQRVNVIIDLDDPQGPASRLGHGYQIDASVIIWSDDDAVRLPIGAAFRKDGDWFAYRVENNKARLTALKIGQRNDTFALVLEGLSPNDVVVLNPGPSIQTGAQVRVREDP